jgi:Protein of unknown function (DUF3738)
VPRIAFRIIRSSEDLRGCRLIVSMFRRVHPRTSDRNRRQPPLIQDLLRCPLLRRPVINKTGIKDFYDFKLVYSREGLPNNGPAPPPIATGGGPGPNASDPRPTIFTTLQEGAWIGARIQQRAARGTRYRRRPQANGELITDVTCA